MAKEKILVVDDEEDILELVRYNLSREGYQVTGSLTGEDALHKVRSEPFDLIVLDLMLPGMDGLAFTKTLKNDSRLRSIPIIMLTAKGEEADIVTGLELGADDYITKPFSPKVMIARVRTALRRHKEEPEDEMAIVKIHDLEINPGRRSVLAKDDPIDLTYTEFQLLLLLAKRPGWVFTRYHIVDLIRGSDYPVTDRSVDVQIVGLRKKLGTYGKYIETARGIGSGRPHEQTQTIALATFPILSTDHSDFTAGRQLVCIRGHAPIFSGPDRHRPQSQSRSSG